MKIGVQLYDENGCGVGRFIANADTIPELIEILDTMTGGYFTYELFIATDNDKSTFSR